MPPLQHCEAGGCAPLEENQDRTRAEQLAKQTVQKRGEVQNKVGVRLRGGAAQQVVKVGQSVLVTGWGGKRGARGRRG